jgi:hypothetical protein
LKLFEVSSRKSKNGRRKFKLILHEIYPDSCIDTVNEIGTIYNENGITWIEEYCQNNLSTVKDMSLRVEFADEFNRVEILGHGETGLQDGLPLFENADVVGHFTNAYIDEIVEDGVTKKVAIGEGYLDEMCYPDFVAKLIEDTANDEAPYGSVEIYRSGDNSGIVYKYGYKENGRIPTDYIYSGYALLGIRPADKTARLLEINESNKEEKTMDENQVKALIGQVVAEMLATSAELNKCKEECAAQVAAASEAVAAKDKQIEELNSQISSIQSELDACKREKNELNTANETMQTEINSLKETIVESQKKEKIGELNAAIADFSDEEKAYAQAEIDAFNADPITSEVNSVVNAILVGVGKKAREAAAVVAEQNAAKADIEDIFAEVGVTPTSEEDSNIF